MLVAVGSGEASDVPSLIVPTPGACARELIGAELAELGVFCGVLGIAILSACEEDVDGLMAMASKVGWKEEGVHTVLRRAPCYVLGRPFSEAVIAGESLRKCSSRRSGRDWETQGWVESVGRC